MPGCAAWSWLLAAPAERDSSAGRSAVTHEPLLAAQPEFVHVISSGLFNSSKAESDLRAASGCRN